jgi:hypothetical protein
MATVKALYEIPIATAKNYLRVDHNIDNDLIALLSAGAVEKVSDYLNRDDYEAIEDVPTLAKMAALRLVADWYDNRDTITTRLTIGGGPGSTQKEIGEGPWTLGNMLDAIRKNPGT